METLLNGKLEDLSGRGSHGAMTGTVATTGRVGGARDFDGVSDFVDVPDSASLDVQRVTLAAWVKLDQVRADGLIWKGDATIGYAMTITSAQKMRLSIGGPAGTRTLDTVTSIPQGVWTHIAATYDGFTLKVYINGAVDNAATHGTQVLIGDSPLPLRISGQPNTGPPPSYPTDGVVDEVHIFSRVLSDAEVTTLYQSSETGFYTKAYFDSLGRRLRTVRRDMFGAVVSTESYTLDYGDRILTYTLVRDGSTSYTTQYGYDALGRPTSVLYPGTANPLTIAYDDVNRIRTVEAENGRKVAYVSDLAGRTTQVREYYDASNYYATSYEYDGASNLVEVTNALNQVTTHAYDNLNRLTRTTYPDATKYEEYTYDAVGNLKTRRDRSGVVTTNVYDGLYRLTQIDYPGTTQEVSFFYDANGNPTSVQNPGATVAYTYDGVDRVLTETSTVSGVAGNFPVGYDYDAAGRVTRLTYPDGYAVDYTYDPIGRTKQVKSGSTTFATLSYYADDLVKDVTFGSQIVQSFAYNGRGWPTSITATYGATTYLNLGYTYDGSGNVLTMGSASFTYDALDRLKTASGGFGSRTYGYDAVGNRQYEDLGTSTWYTLRPNVNGDTVQWSQSPTAGYNYDKVDEAGTNDGDSTYVFASLGTPTDLYHVTDLPGPGSVEQVTVTALARYVDSSPPPPPPCKFPPCIESEPGVEPMADSGSLYLSVKTNGQARTSAAYPLTSGYGSVGWTLTTNPVTGNAWTEAEVNALQAGVQLSSTSSEVRVTQVYVSVKVDDKTTYGYDGNGMNELTSLSGATTATFTYDGNGNLDTKTGGWDYDWNSENLMTVAKQNGAQQQAYVYDGLGRRVKVDGTSSSAWTVSIVSGMDVVYEEDQSGAVTKYVYANGMRVAKVTPSGAVQYYLGDHLGSTQQVRDSARGLVFSAEYEPFGKPYAVSGGEAYKFTGERHDDPTGLVYLRARQYDPDLGRFVGADPVLGSLSKPQTLNRYPYVANNPLRYTDPSGQVINLIAAGIGAVAGAAIGGLACAAAQGWTWSDQCWVAMGAGAVAGGIAGLTFGASLIATSAAVSVLGGSGTVAAVASTLAAGALSGAAGGLAGYLAEGTLTSSFGGSFDWSVEGALASAGYGALGGMIGAGAGMGFSKIAGVAAQRFAASTFTGRAATSLNNFLRLAAGAESSLSLRSFGAALGTALFEGVAGDVAVSLLRDAFGWSSRTDPVGTSDRNYLESPASSGRARVFLGGAMQWYVESS